MPELDKQLNFNAFELLLCILFINLILYGDIDYIMYTINYIITLNTLSFWFIISHIISACIILASLQFEFGFHAAVKFNSAL
jgi:hypothetical protein